MGFAAQSTGVPRLQRHLTHHGRTGSAVLSVCAPKGIRALVSSLRESGFGMRTRTGRCCWQLSGLSLFGLVCVLAW